MRKDPGDRREHEMRRGVREMDGMETAGVYDTSIVGGGEGRGLR